MQSIVLAALLAACGGADDSTPGSAKFARWLQPSHFRGFDIGYYNYGDGTKSAQDFVDLKRLGVTVAQIQTVEGTRNDAAPYAPNPNGIEALDKLVGWCRDAGLSYVIAVRAGPGRQSVDREAQDTIWSNSQEQQLYAAMLRDDIVAKYGDDPLFVGINLMVEPNPFNREIVDGTIGDAEDLRAAMRGAGIDINAMMARFISAVRTVDRTLPVIVQAPGWSGPEWFGLLDKQSDPYVVYDVHLYDPRAYTHPGCGAPNCDGLAYPGMIEGETFDKTTMRDRVLARVRAFQRANDVPIFMGEFGMEFAQAGGVRYLSDVQDIAVEYGWHFCAWNFRSDTRDPKTLNFDYEKWDSSYAEEIATWW